MRTRIEAELALLRAVYGDVEHAEADGEDWIRIPAYPVPPGWERGGEEVAITPVSFPVKADYPGTAPYGFLVPAGMIFGGSAPQDTAGPPKPVPFSGGWLHFSWTVDDWKATSDPGKGSNLVAWCRSFAVRLKQGV